MGSDFLSPEEEGVMRALELAQSPWAAQILKLDRQIKSETQDLERRASVGQPVYEQDIQKIVDMKLKLDGLYAAWAQGKIE